MPPKARNKQKLEKPIIRHQAVPILPPEPPTPPPEPFFFPPNRPNFCDYVTYLFLIVSVIISAFSTYHWIMISGACSKAEIIVERICMPKLEKLTLLVDTTIPDFSMTPIGRDIAEKCADVEECLSAITCKQLIPLIPFPERCEIYQFFHYQFATCREKLQKIRDPPKCVKQFQVSGPIYCDVLHEHLECYREQIQEICGDEEDLMFMYYFNRYIEDYKEVIDCVIEEEEEEVLGQ